MPILLPRRTFLTSSAATGLAATAPAVLRPRPALAASPLRLGPAQPFSFDTLIARARELAGQAYVPPPQPDPAIVQRIDYDAYGRIRSRPEAALWADGPGVFPVTFKMVGQFFTKTVRMHSVEGGQAREVLYSPDYFDMPADHVARGLPEQPSAFAGFWVEESRVAGDWTRQEPWVTFLGAAYWRAKGELGQVGLSSRAVALGTGDQEPEEFPDFIAHWFEPALRPEEPVVVSSLMDGPSVAGAFRFRLFRTRGVVIEVESHLFFRRGGKRLGIAPLTSMFWFGEDGKRLHEDWRPEVHDSDGLAIWTGAGERIWRPLANPRRIVTSSFLDRDPKGFGLLQRDREFENYLDGVRYESRPSAWIEPLGAWGEGAVQLVEIPTDDEIYDNINAFWHPREPQGPGTALRFAYRQHWLADEPSPPPALARVIATRIGRGGQPGRSRLAEHRKFSVEFAGPALDALPESTRPEAVVTASRGTPSLVFTERVPRTTRWRAFFDIEQPGDDPVDLRLFLRGEAGPLSETWLYQLQRER
jgi:glucans biosynthesis protein